MDYAYRPDEELITIAQEIYDSIYRVDCYSISDHTGLYYILDILTARGYDIHDDTKDTVLTIVKYEDDRLANA